MIISHKHKFIFLKTHKTAGTSLQIALSKHCGEKDVISKLHPNDDRDLAIANGRGIQNSKVPFNFYNTKDWFQFLGRGRRQHYSEHLDALYLKRWVSDEIWNTYYKFCFERNPFEKVLSFYYWRERDSNISIDEFIANNLAQLSDREIYSYNMDLIVDDVFLYEDIEQAIILLEEKFDFEIPISRIQAKSGFRKDRKHYNEVFSRTQLKLIAKYFKFEINNFYPELKEFL